MKFTLRQASDISTNLQGKLMLLDLYTSLQNQPSLLETLEVNGIVNSEDKHAFLTLLAQIKRQEQIKSLDKKVQVAHKPNIYQKIHFFHQNCLRIQQLRYTHGDFLEVLAITARLAQQRQNIFQSFKATKNKLYRLYTYLKDNPQLWQDLEIEKWANPSDKLEFETHVKQITALPRFYEAQPPIQYNSEPLVNKKLKLDTQADDLKLIKATQTPSNNLSIENLNLTSSKLPTLFKAIEPNLVKSFLKKCARDQIALPEQLTEYLSKNKSVSNFQTNDDSSDDIQEIKVEETVPTASLDAKRVSSVQWNREMLQQIQSLGTEVIMPELYPKVFYILEQSPYLARLPIPVSGQGLQISAPIKKGTILGIYPASITISPDEVYDLMFKGIPRNEILMSKRVFNNNFLQFSHRAIPNLKDKTKVALPSLEEEELAKLLLLPPLMLANHSQNPRLINAEIVEAQVTEHEYVICFQACRDIKPGEELLVNYGDDYQSDLSKSTYSAHLAIKVPPFVKSIHEYYYAALRAHGKTYADCIKIEQVKVEEH